MKVKVYYMVLEEKFVEVNNEYEKLLDDDWCAENEREESLLTDRIAEEVDETLPRHADLVAIWSEDNIPLYEN